MADVAVGVEVVEPIPLGQSVHPVLLRDFFPRQPLAEARRHRLQFRQRRAARGGVPCAVLHYQFLHHIRALQHHAAARMPRAELAEIFQEGALPHRFKNPARVVNALHRELNDRARLDVPARADVVADSRGHRAKRLASVIVICIDNPDGHLCAHANDEATHPNQLVGGQRQLEVRLRADRPVRVIPHVMHAAGDEFAQPLLGEQFVNVRLANARCHASEDFFPEAIVQSAQRTDEDFFLPAPLVAGDLTALDADERGRIADFSQAPCDLLGDNLPVRENLKVTVGVRPQQVEKLWVHERLAAKNSKERVSMPFRVGDRAIECVEVNRVFLLDIHPAALAAQVARVENREIKERRKILAVSDAPLEFFHRQHALHAEVPREFPKQPRVGRAQNAKGE